MSQNLDLNPNHKTRWSAVPFRVSVLLALVSFPLIWFGGLVTTTESGMAVPDWPGTFEHNMFTFPIYDWFFGPWDLFVEHGHRLLASLSGLIAIGLVIVTVAKHGWGRLGWAAVALLVLVIAQGLLGGLRVLLDERALVGIDLTKPGHELTARLASWQGILPARTIAKIHGCVGPAFFAAVIAFAVRTSRWWHEQATRPAIVDHWPSLSRQAIGLLLLAYLQLVLGAFLRHVAVDSRPTMFLHLVYTHVTLAAVLLISTLWYGWRTWRRRNTGHGLWGWSRWLVVAMVGQFSLGLTTWVFKYGWPTWFDHWIWANQFVIPARSFWQMNVLTAHGALGSAILGLWVVQVLRIRRLRQLGKRAEESPEIGQATGAVGVQWSSMAAPGVQTK